jgi:hypothetical protein
MNIFKKLFSNKLTLVVTTLLLFILFIFYNSFLTNHITYHNIEGLAPMSNQLSCINNADPFICPTGTNGKPYTLLPGTCAESYGPLSSNPSPDTLLRCIDRSPPQLATTSGSATSDVTQSFCTDIQHTKTKYQNIMSYYDCPS